MKDIIMYAVRFSLRRESIKGTQEQFCRYFFLNEKCLVFFIIHLPMLQITVSLAHI